MAAIVAGVLSLTVLCATAPASEAPRWRSVHPDGALQPAGAVEPRPFLLIHPAKTGGSSVEAGLLGITLEKTVLQTPECEGVPVMDRRYEKHDTAAIAQTFYSEQEWQTAYKFTLVRNPWERLVSWWAMHATPPLRLDTCGCNGSDQALMTEILNDTDPSIGNTSFLCAFSFYFDNCLALKETELNGVNVTEWVNYMEGNNSARLLTFMEDAIATSEHATILTRTHSLVDFVGRTENLNAHVEEALVLAGNSRETAAACAASLPYIDEGSLDWGDDYTLYYGSEHKRERALNVFEPDIKAFLYAYDTEGPYDFMNVDDDRSGELGGKPPSAGAQAGNQLSA